MARNLFNSSRSFPEGTFTFPDGSKFILSNEYKERSRNARSNVLKFDDEEAREFPEFQYRRLPDLKKSIRLLRLNRDTLHSPWVDCEIFDAEYDDKHRLHEIRSNGEGQSIDIVKYEALSWCWGSEEPDHAIMISYDNNTYRKKVTRELALALKYLRKGRVKRTLWIDAICINQANYEERNHQVQMMSMIYTQAEQVCVWLGEDTEDSQLAIRFIKEEIIKLENFDDVCSNNKNADKWRSLLVLMQRPWFSRRWVVQEIALASKATVYCGEDEISWSSFAVAVELFVEVETATHRLSEVMQKDERFYHVPGWFEFVSELGASLLVSATAKIFRQYKSTAGEAPDNPIYKRGLLSLEYLVSTLFIFDVTKPHDAIYSLLAIAKDTAPVAEFPIERKKDEDALLFSTFGSLLERKPYAVDYNQPYVEVCKDFISFCIKRAYQSDRGRALDILCRPWAPTVYVKSPSDPGNEKSEVLKVKHQRMNQPPTQRQRFYMRKHRSPAENHITNDVDADHPAWGCVREEILDKFPIPKAEIEPSSAETGNERDQESKNTAAKEEKLHLPSWIASIDNAPFGLSLSPGMHLKKMGRKNADPLVGLPEDGRRNYSAAQSRGLDLKTLRFRHRPRRDTHSLYVKGFILDEVQELAPYSQGGGIPKEWFELGGWSAILRASEIGHSSRPDEEVEKNDPPPEFWRTLVADRGKDNRNPPYYYAKACQECVKKGGILSGRVNIEALINNERNSVIAEFSRRVQAVIWNRRMIRTKNGRLGLVSRHVERGDLVCIIYGCTVPVILRRNRLKEICDVEDEVSEDRVESLKDLILKCEDNCIRKVLYSPDKITIDNVKDDVSINLIRRSTKMIEKQLEDWKVAKESSKKQDEETKKRRNDVYEAWSREKEAQDEARGLQKEETKTEDEQDDLPPSERYLDGESQQRLQAIFEKYESDRELLDDVLRVHKPFKKDLQGGGSRGNDRKGVDKQDDVNGKDTNGKATDSKDTGGAEADADPDHGEAADSKDSAEADADQDHDKAVEPPNSKDVDGKPTDAQDPEQGKIDSDSSRSRNNVENNSSSSSSSPPPGPPSSSQTPSSPPAITPPAAPAPASSSQPPSPPSTALDEHTRLRIRDLHSSYRFLGESYIHGMMDGEAMREQYYNSIPDQVFELI